MLAYLRVVRATPPPVPLISGHSFGYSPASFWQPFPFFKPARTYCGVSPCAPHEWLASGAAGLLWIGPLVANHACALVMLRAEDWPAPLIRVLPVLGADCWWWSAGGRPSWSRSVWPSMQAFPAAGLARPPALTGSLAQGTAAAVALVFWLPAPPRLPWRSPCLALALIAWGPLVRAYTG